jgi:AraC-like DNA-binding protein
MRIERKVGRLGEGGGVIRFGWLSFLLTIGALQGLVVAALLAFKRENRTANYLLAAFLVAFVARIVPYIIGFAGFYDAFPWLSFAPFGITLAYGPLLYLYVSRLTSERLPRRWWAHLLPAAVQLAYYCAIFVQPLPFKNVYDGRVHEPIVDPIETALTLLSLYGYLYAAWKQYARYEAWLEQSKTSSRTGELRWLRTFLIVFGVTIVADTGFEAYSLAIHRLSYFQFFALYLWFAAMAYYLALEGWRNASRTYALPRMRTVAKKTASPSAGEAAAWLDLVRRDEHWRDPELTLSVLAEKMNQPAAQISRIVNDGLGMNFNEAINRLRVDAVATRLANPSETGEILAIALDCGFASKASFNRAFRNYKGVTPSAYRESAPSL